MNTTIDLKTAKTIEAMNQKINHMDNAVTDFFSVVFDDHLVQLVLFFFSHDSKGNIIRKVPFLRQLFKPLRLGKGRPILYLNCWTW